MSLMKNPYEVLKQKETELARTQHEIECLRITASLLEEEPSSKDLSESSTKNTPEHEPKTKATGTEGLFSSYDSRPKFWGVLKRR